MTNRQLKYLALIWYLLGALAFWAAYNGSNAQTPQGLTVDKLQQGPALSGSDMIMVLPSGSPPGSPGNRQSLDSLKTFFSVTSPSINSVASTPSSFVAQAGNANRVVGALTATVSSGTFAGDFGLATNGTCPGPDNASFAITSSTLSINTTDVTAVKNYTLCVRVRDTNFSNSPAFFPLTLAGTAAPPPATISSVSVSPSSFTAQAGNQNTTIGTFATAVSTGTFAGTYALSTTGGCSGHGADNASFAISGASLRVGSSAVTVAQNYAICLLATDSAYSNSPFPQQLTITGTSGPPPATITSVTATPATFVAQAGNAGITVGALSTAVSTGSFAGIYNLSTSGGCSGHGADNASFAITGATLKLNTSDVLTARAYAICLLATDVAFSNSPFPQQLTITGTTGSAATITSVSVSPSSFTAAAGNAGSNVGAFSTVVSTGSFAGTYNFATGAGCDSTNNASFAISGANLNVGSSDAFNGIAYHICVSATDAAFSNSPKLQALTIQGNGSSVVVVGDPTIAPSAPVQVTFANGVGLNWDWIAIFPSSNAYDDLSGEIGFTYLNGSSSSPPSPQLTAGTVTLTASPSSPGTYSVRYHADPGSSPTTVAATPLIVSGTPQINSVSVSPATFTAQAGNATSAIGTLSAAVSSGSFGGTFGFATGAGCTGNNNSQFTITGSTLKVGASDITVAGPYSICVAATDGAFGNSPKLMAITVTGFAGSGPGTITSVSVSPNSFVAQAGNANATVGQLSTLVSSGSFAGTYAMATDGSCTSTDNADFVVSGTSLRLHSSDVTTVRTYTLCVSATDAAFTNSPKFQTLTVNGIAVGSAITTVSFKNLSGSTLPAGTPVSMGQGFAYGDIAPGTHPLIRDASTHTALAGQQWNEISTRRENGQDGSWRHAVWAAWLPSSLANGATAQFEFISAAGTYSESSHQPLSALCAGPAAHDLKLHLTDIRNVNDTVRDSGDATFRVCDNINNTGRDAPRHLAAGNVMDEYVVSGLLTYTSGHQDPLLYVQCNVDLFTKSSDGTSAGDVRWTCHVHNSWMNVAAGSTGNPGNPGPAGFANDPQYISYRAEVDDGSTNVLDWSGLDATISSSSNPVVAASGPCTNDWGNFCMLVPSSTGANAWYLGQATRVSCSANCIGGLTNGQLVYVGPASSESSGGTETRYVEFLKTQTGGNGLTYLTGTQGTGTTSFSARIPHPHFRSWETVDASGWSNWAPFGSATRVTRKVYPILTTTEIQYWQRSGLIPPIHLDQPSLPNLVDYSQGLGITYAPMGYMNMRGTGGTGARSDIGLTNEYSAKALITQAAADWDNMRLGTYCSPRDGDATTLNEATGRIPVLNNGPPTGPGGNGNGGSYTGLGSGATTNQALAFKSISGMADPRGKLDANGQDPSGGVVYTGNDHMPGFNGFTYMVFGDRHFLDLMQLRGNADMLQQSPGPSAQTGQAEGSRDALGRFTDGQVYHYWGLNLVSFGSRGSAWMMRDIVYPSAFGADDYPLVASFANNPERSYFNDMVTENSNYWPIYLTYSDGPGSVSYSTSLFAPDTTNTGSIGPAVEIFIRNYLTSVQYDMTAWLHSPLADLWNVKQQVFFEGMTGHQMFGAPSSYYSIVYITNPATIDGDADPSSTGASVGSAMNGVDASDYGEWQSYAALLTGGQWQYQGGSDISQGGSAKFFSGWGQGFGVKIDQLPGNRWFTMTNINAGANTFSLLCTAADHTAFPSQCPVAGQAFTGYTANGGTPISNINGVDISSEGPAFRFNSDPGPGQGYSSNNYTPYGQQSMSAMAALGLNLPNAFTDLSARAGTGYNSNTPQFNWDHSVVVAGLPAVVTYSHQFASLACGASPGTVVSSLGLIQGNGGGPGAWTISKSTDPTHYAISGNNLVTVGTLPCGASQAMQVTTTQSGGRPAIGELHLHVNGSGGGGATINSISLTPQTFVAMSGNATHTVGNLFAAVSSGSFGGTFALSTSGGCSGLGANNGLFTITGSTFKIGSSDITGAGAKAVCVSATDGAFTNSPQYQAFTVTGTSGPSLVVNGGSSVVSGMPVSITLSNGLGNARDWINIVPTGSGASVIGTWAYLNGSQTPPSSPVALPATITLTAGAAGSYEIRYLINDGFTVGATTPLTVTGGSTSAPGPLAVLGSNPHYFKTPDGKAIYLTGLHTWTDFVTVASQGASSFTQFADYVATQNESLIRLWSGLGLLTAFNGDPSQATSPIAFNRSGTCCAADGGNKFDLTSFNATFFSQLQNDVRYAASKGMYVMPQLLYHFNGTTGPGWNELVFNGANNINGTTTSNATAYAGSDSTTVNFEKAFVHHLLDTLGSEPNVIFEMSNEPDSSVSFTYENSLIDDVHSYETSHSYGPHPIAANMPSSFFTSSHGDFVIDQDFGGTPGISSLGKPVVLDTDHTFGIGGGTDWWWQVFMNGNNPLSMDDMHGTGVSGNYDLGNTTFYTLEAQNRLGIQQQRVLTGMVDMTAMVPHPELSNLGFALADTAGHKFIVYAGGVGSVTVNLSSAPSIALRSFWLSTANGSLSSTVTLTGGSSAQSFTSPFGGTPAVLVVIP